MMSQSLLMSVDSIVFAFWGRSSFSISALSRVSGCISFCDFYAFLWLVPFAENDPTQRSRTKLAAIINDLSAKKSLFYDALQRFACIGREFMPMMNKFLF